MDMQYYFEQKRKATRAALEKIKNPMTEEELKKKYPETRPQIIKKVEVEEEELTDEEYDAIYYSQEDDTVNESYDGDYNPYGKGVLTETSDTAKAIKRKNEEYDAPFPEGFDSWSGYAKGAWYKKHIIKKENEQ